MSTQGAWLAGLSMLAACACLPLAKAIRAWHRVRVAASPPPAPVPEAQAVSMAVPSAPPLALEVDFPQERLNGREDFFFHPTHNPKIQDLRNS